MPTEIIFHLGEGSDPIPTVELHGKLADAFKTHCSLDVHEAGGQLVLSEVGIVLSLIFDEIGNPVTAMAEVSHSSRVEYVSLLCHVFREMGWEF